MKITDSVHCKLKRNNNKINVVEQIKVNDVIY